MNEEKESLIDRFQNFVDGRIDYYEFFNYLNSSEFTRARKSETGSLPHRRVWVWSLV